jgi:hypothetical protein
MSALPLTSNVCTAANPAPKAHARKAKRRRVGGSAMFAEVFSFFCQHLIVLFSVKIQFFFVNT